MRADLLASELGMFTIGDIIQHYPFRYVDRSIYVFYIATVVHSVMRWRIKNSRKPARHFVDYFGVNPELVEEIEGTYQQEPFCFKSQQSQREIKIKRKHFLKDTLPQGHRKIVIFALMMHHVAEPKQIDFMAHPVRPVIEKIDPDKTQNDRSRMMNRQGQYRALLFPTLLCKVCMPAMA